MEEVHNYDLRIIDLEGENRLFFRNVGKYLPDYTVSKTYFSTQKIEPAGYSHTSLRIYLTA
jgi:hypothetical protein